MPPDGKIYLPAEATRNVRVPVLNLPDSSSFYCVIIIRYSSYQGSVEDFDGVRAGGDAVLCDIKVME